MRNYITSINTQKGVLNELIQGTNPDPVKLIIHVLKESQKESGETM